MSEDNTPVDGDAVEAPETVAVDLSAMTETELRERHTELKARRDELAAKDKTVAELAELGDITSQMNETAEAVNKFVAGSGDVVDLAEPVVPDEVPADIENKTDDETPVSEDAPVGDEGPDP